MALCLLGISTTTTLAQELDFQVTVNTPKLQTADPIVFESLEKALLEFINTRDWIDDKFLPEERIKGSIQLTITKDLSTTSFEADLAIQATRPAYGSTYETALLNHVDKGIRFSFEQFEPLIYTQDVFNDNLSSIISFYVYLILGMDYDTFSPLGGSTHFLQARQIVNSLPNQIADYQGWASLKSNRNRFWMIDNILNPKVKPYRRAMYDYHRQGLDLMSTDTETGKATMLTALAAIDEVHKSYPNSMIIQMFSNTKSEEIVEIFKVGSREQKSKISQIMTRVDPAHASKYRQIGR